MHASFLFFEPAPLPRSSSVRLQKRGLTGLPENPCSKKSLDRAFMSVANFVTLLAPPVPGGSTASATCSGTDRIWSPRICRPSAGQLQGLLPRVRGDRFNFNSTFTARSRTRTRRGDDNRGSWRLDACPRRGRPRPGGPAAPGFTFRCRIIYYY